MSNESAIPKTVTMAISRAAEKLVKHFDVPPNQVLTAPEPSRAIYLKRTTTFTVYSHNLISGKELSFCFAFLGISHRSGQRRQREGNNGHNYLVYYNKNNFIT